MSGRKSLQRRLRRSDLVGRQVITVGENFKKAVFFRMANLQCDVDTPPKDRKGLCNLLESGQVYNYSRSDPM